MRVCLHALKVGNTNLLTAMGMIIMLLPPFAAVKYDELFVSLRSIPKRLAFGSVLVNWAMLGTGYVFPRGFLGREKLGTSAISKSRCLFSSSKFSEFFLV